MERDLAQIQREIIAAKNDAKKMEVYRDKYLQLDKLVKQLYIDACDSTGLVNTKGAKNGATFITDNAGKEDSFSGEDHPNFSKPEQTVNALRSLYYCSGPTRAGKMLRELIVYVNRMYKHHILRDSGEFYEAGDVYEMPNIFSGGNDEDKARTKEDLRFKPAEILEHISALIDKKALLEKNLRNRMKRAVADSKKAQEDKEKALRALRKNNIIVEF